MSSLEEADDNIKTISVHPTIAKNVQCYKIVGGNHTLESYNQQCLQRSKGESDWEALYTQFHRDHVLGTLPYRWESGESQAKLIRVTFEELVMLRVEGSIMYDGAMSGSEKAALLKPALGIKPDEPLMGQAPRPLLVRETQHEWELVFPHGLLSRGEYEEEVIAVFRRPVDRPITTSWSMDGGETWKRWDENESAVLSRIPDLPTTWQTREGMS